MNILELLRRGACASLVALAAMTAGGHHADAAVPAGVEPAAYAAPVRVDPAAPPDGNLPVYTSPIDITRGAVQIRAVAPDRDTGAPKEVTLPTEFLPPDVRALAETPLGARLDGYWNGNRDPQTGRTPRAEACDGDEGIKRQVRDAVAKLGRQYSAYDISCNLATKGIVVAKQTGSTVYLSYQLLGNAVDFYVTSSATCHRDHGTPFCPDDPHFVVHFATEMWTVVRAPGICQITAENGTVDLQAVSIEGRNGVGGLVRFIKADKFGGAARALEAMRKKMPLPLDDTFRKLRESAPCADRAHPAAPLVAAFSAVEPSLDPVKGIVFRVVHPAIAAPRFQNVDATAPVTPSTPEQGGFVRPTLSGPPVVTAGAQMQLNGQLFPPTTDTSTILRLALERDATAACNGGGTEIEWGAAGVAPRIEKGSGPGCASRHELKGLTPATDYRLRARDCDAVTCSPWTAPLTLRTSPVREGAGAVTLTMDGATLGTATVDATGNFTSTVTVAAGVPAGQHTITAVSGAANATTTVEVKAPGPVGGSGTLKLTGTFFGDRGCPMRPLPRPLAEIDAPFSIFGSGFAAGPVTVHVDSPTGASLGTATAQADGTFCKADFQGPSQALLGDHTLYAVQDGIVRGTTPVTFVRPTVVR